MDPPVRSADTAGFLKRVRASFPQVGGHLSPKPNFVKDRRKGFELTASRGPWLPLCLLAVTGLALHLGPPTLGRLMGDGMGNDPVYRQWRALQALADQSALEAKGDDSLETRARILGGRTPPIKDLWGQPIMVQVAQDQDGRPVLLLVSAGPDRRFQTDPSEIMPRSDDILVLRRWP